MIAHRETRMTGETGNMLVFVELAPLVERYGYSPLLALKHISAVVTPTDPGMTSGFTP